jgi:tetratricopeptide (TPR) repeat protein
MRLSVLSLAILLIAGPTLAVPDDLENAFQSLKDAESRKDAAQVMKLAAETCALARQAISAPAPESAAEKEAWSTRVARARSIELHTEYALTATAIQAPPSTAVDLWSALERQNQASKYLDEAYGHYFLALDRLGAAAKIPAVADRAFAQFPDNEDLLLVLADTAMNRKQSDLAHRHAERLVAVLAKHPKPEGLSPADWERKRGAALGRGYWIAGLVHSDKTQYYEADKDLRAALPLIRGSDAMLAPALFHLGVVNYQLGKTLMRKAQVLEAVKFSEQAAALRSPYAEQAWRNAYIMKTEAAKMR